ncbi:MAG: hypothetical protein WKF40_11410 [Thermoleophilaceae bacterium]
MTFLIGPFNDESVTDLPLYSDYASIFLDGALPFRDVAFEYPPLAAPVIAVSGLAGGTASYRVAFAVLTFLFAVATVCLCGELGPSQRRRSHAGHARRGRRAAAVRGDDPHPLRPRAGGAHPGRAGLPVRRPPTRGPRAARGGRSREALPAGGGAGRPGLARVARAATGRCRGDGGARGGRAGGLRRRAVAVAGGRTRLADLPRRTSGPGRELARGRAAGARLGWGRDRRRPTTAIAPMGSITPAPVSSRRCSRR